MQGNLNPRVIGSCLIGLALVAGAYTVSNFGIVDLGNQAATVVVSETTSRVAIAVNDADDNGIEDWRDEFVQTEAIVIEPIVPGSVYVPPTTLTGQLGVNFMESYLRSKTQGSFGRTQEQLIGDAVDVLEFETAHDLYDLPDITIMQAWEDEDVVTYANTIALAIANNNQSAITEGEMFILHDIVTNNAVERVDELVTLSNTYKNMRDQTLATPVPNFLVREHLNLINTYHAIHKDIEAMTISVEDPAFSLMRLKRYEDDATGLGFALRNMYDAIEPYSDLVQADDPALLLVIFSDDFTS